MKGLALGAAAVVLLLVLWLAFFGGLGFFFPVKPGPDTETHSSEVAGYYGDGSFAGELLQSDVIVTNITDGNYSQSVVFQGKVCQRVPGLGKVFLDGARSTEPDAQYKVLVNGMLQYTVNMEVGSSSPLSGCFEFAVRDYVMTGQTAGVVQVQMFVYVFDFTRGAGAYSLLAYDTAVLQ